jgi:hypothetical protein
MCWQRWQFGQSAINLDSRWTNRSPWISNDHSSWQSGRRGLPEVGSWAEAPQTSQRFPARSQTGIRRWSHSLRARMPRRLEPPDLFGEQVGEEPAQTDLGGLDDRDLVRVCGARLGGETGFDAGVSASPGGDDVGKSAYGLACLRSRWVSSACALSMSSRSCEGGAAADAVECFDSGFVGVLDGVEVALGGADGAVAEAVLDDDEVGAAVEEPGGMGVSERSLVQSQYRPPKRSGPGSIGLGLIRIRVGWPSGEAAACKAVYTGSTPVPTSIRISNDQSPVRRALFASAARNATHLHWVE